MGQYEALKEDDIIGTEGGLRPGLNVSSKPSAGRLSALWIFLGLSAGLSWTVWLWPVPNRAVFLNVSGWRIAWPFVNIKLLVGNCLPGLLALVWTCLKGKQQLRGLLSSVFAWRVRVRWYILAVALPCGVFLASLLWVLMRFPGKPILPPKLLLVTSLWSLPFGPVWEEIAWRAFALRRLECRYSRLTSACVIGVYWAVWHIPLWRLTLSYLTGELLLIACMNLVAWSIIFSFLYDRSGQSLPITILLHGTYFTIQNLVFATIPYSNIHLIPVAALLSVLVAATMAEQLRTDGSPC